MTPPRNQPLDVAKRLYVAMILPTLPDQSIDEPGLRAFVRYFADNERFAKVGGLVANAEAGEIFYMTREEKKRVLQIVLEEVKGRMPVIAGSYAWTTQESVDTARDAKDLGATGLFVSPPAGALDISLGWDSTRYPEVWLDQIKAQDAACDMPIFIHPVTNVSQPWGIGLPLEPSLKIVREVPNVVGWKTTYNYVGHRLLSRAMRDQAPHLALLCSSAHFFHEYLAVGNFDGTISGSWSYALEPMLDHIEAMQRGDLAAARAVWDGGMCRLHEYVYSEPSRLHVRYKVAAWLRGFTSTPRMRQPMPAPRDEEITRLVSLMKAAGLPIVADGAPR